jgi:predicted TIM-barrel fold metal-dependent hydrolase
MEDSMPLPTSPRAPQSAPVVDCHAHILPYLGGPSGFASTQEHLLYVQRAMATHGAQPVRRRRDLSIVTQPTLWDPSDPSPQGRYEVGFHAGRNGRFAWTKDGEEYFLQFMPPNLQTMEAPAECLITQMDYAGIDVAILQNDHIYGSLNEYFSDAIRRYPDRFIGLAQVEESLAFKDEQIERLRHACGDLGMSGLYFSTSTFFTTGYRNYYGGDEFVPFWNEVRKMGLPVFWVFPASSPMGDFEAEMRYFRGWLERYPEVPSVLVHGLPDNLFADEQGRLSLPAYVTELIDSFPVQMELLFPIRWGGKWDYPYPQALELVRQYCDRFGAQKLLWGSDMPNVERYCTYRQTLDYLVGYCDFISEADMALILGGNALRLIERD